ncbi:MAG: hypothetical protein EOP83_18245 [Verrucomicrobiaceae bacterium]|nr:MAG: hypothetical protein EOP83_18245 [Verrucomicrobiaceae bacterium]
MSYRKLNIDGRQWSYKIGKTHAHIRSPEGKGEAVKLSDLSRDYQEQSTSDPFGFYLDARPKFEVKPSDIRRWIESAKEFANWSKALRTTFSS